LAFLSPAFAQLATEQGEDVRGRENALRLYSDLKSSKLKLGADMYTIIEKYGEPYKMDVAEDVSEIRYRIRSFGWLSRSFRFGFARTCPS
jgi:hypothetical protein